MLEPRKIVSPTGITSLYKEMAVHDTAAAPLSSTDFWAAIDQPVSYDGIQEVGRNPLFI
jgi:hypothetical protein